MRVPSNIRELAEKNEALLNKIGFTPGVDDPFELCSEAVYRRTGLFDDEAIRGMFTWDERRHLQRLQCQAESRVARRIGMILVRPDMVHVSAEFERFVAERFRIMEAQTVTIDAATYWRIYQHDFYRENTKHSRLTRAALYIGSQCRLVVFRSFEDEPTVATADYARGPLKGQQGVFQPGTLRGDIVYRNALALDLHRLDEGVEECTRLATDPFTAFRKLAAHPTEEYRDLQYPLLFFTGVGVHIPDYSELENDLSSFVDTTRPPYAP